MRYRRLGSSGCQVSVISFGSWLTVGGSIPQSLANGLVRRAFERGVNFFDTADVYARGAAEEALAVALEPIRRADYVLATKCFFPMSENVNDRGLSRKHVFESVHASLRRLKTDYIDLMQCHRFDPATEVEEVVRAMEDLIRQGKVLYWGVSCWDREQVAAACASADRVGAYRPVSNQPPYNLMERAIEADVLPECARLGLSQIVFSPLAQGMLTGKYAGGRVPPGSRAADEKRNGFLKPKMTPENLSRAQRAAALAREAGIAPAAAALAWVLRRPEVASAILGATRLEQLDEDLAAADLELPTELASALDALAPPQP
jgi:aryl-alcohol dehydrogenase-like predicted oxidoreductase